MPWRLVKYIDSLNRAHVGPNLSVCSTRFECAVSKEKIVIMNIEKSSVVSFHYRLSDESGQLLEDSRTGHPILYLHGHRSMLPGLEEAMNGRTAGDCFQAILPPEKAYGARREQSDQRISKKHLLTKGKIAPGMTVQIRTEQGPEDAVVTKVGLKTIDVDGNHPYAGKTLTFDLEVVDVREATAEELDHGHAHGVGGHQH